MNHKRLQSVVAMSVLVSMLGLFAWSLVRPVRQRPMLAGATSLPAPPACLCQDDGVTPLPGIRPRTEWAAACCYIAQDLGHAGVNGTNQKPTWELVAVAGATNSRPSITWIEKPTTGYPVTLNPPLTLPGYTGLVLGKCATEGAAGKVVEQAKAVTAAARRTIAPCISFVPLTAKNQSNGWKLPPEAFISAGDSYSIRGWIAPAVVCHLGLGGDVANALQATGELCSTIKTITVEEVCRALGKQPRSDGLLPYFSGNELTIEQNAALFKTIARRANAITLQPIPPDPSPRTDFDLLWELKIAPTGFTDREFAEKFWKMSKALR